jgi:hypothetical protein
VTIIAGGNAIGNFLPPYFVFSGKRWNPEFLKDAVTGSDGEMSDTGWSNTTIFNNYVTKHFAKYGNISKSYSTLLLYDGHRSHINLTLTDSAKKHNVVLFVLPPHTSHLTQPLDVGAFGPLKSMYSKECQMYLQKNPGINITKYEIAELTRRPYLRALSSENLMSAFRATGIYPFDKTVLTTAQMAPSVIYIETQVEGNNDMLPSHGESTVENILSENVSEVSTQISDFDTPKNMEDQIIYTAEPIESDIQASLKTTEISHETIETKTNASSFFLIVLLSEV